MTVSVPTARVSPSRENTSAQTAGLRNPRGRPRSLTIDTAVLESAGRIIAEKGVAAATFEAVAARAGTTRVSIYRRWPTRTALLLAVLSYHSNAPVPPPGGGGGRKDLLELLESFAAMTRGSLGKIGPPIIAEVLSDPSARVAALTRSPSPELVAEASRRLSAALAEAGQPDADLEIRLEAMFGLLFLRALVGNIPPDADLPERVVNLIVGPAALTPAR